MKTVTTDTDRHFLYFPIRAGTPYLMDDCNAGQMMQEPGATLADWQPTLRGNRVVLVRPGGFGDLLFLVPTIRWLQQIGYGVEVSAVDRFAPVLNGICPVVEYPLDLSEHGDKTIVPLENCLEFGEDSRTVHACLAMQRRVADVLGIKPGPLAPMTWEPSARLRHLARVRFPRRNDRFRVAVQLSASSPCRSYPDAKTSRLISALIKANYDVVLCGKPEEVPLASSKQLLNLTVEPDLSFCQAMAVVEQCDAVIAPDSAVCHFAGAMGIPTVALYGSFPRELRTAGQPSIYAIQATGPCAPCFHHGRGGMPFPIGGPCNQAGHCVVLDSIPVDSILDRLRRQLPKEPRPQPREKLQLPTVQLALLDGAREEHAGRVIDFVTSRIDFGHVEHVRPEQAWSYKEAMRYQAKELGRHLPDGMTHQLSIECDGFPVHPDRWLETFLTHDYIGAPWPAQVVSGDNRVGNGGCTLRTRQFIRAIDPVDYEDGCPGDVWWCQHKPVQDAVRAAGCKYAHVEAAAHFAMELPIPEHPTGWTHRMAFGFHKTLPSWWRMVNA